MKNMFVLCIFFDGFCFFLMCVVVDCDDLAMNGVFPLEGFNRYVAVSVVECLWVTLLEIALETTWDFIWSVFDTCARLCLRFYLVFVWNHVSNCIYNIYIYCLWLYLGLPVLLLDIWLVCLCFAFVWVFAQHCEATPVNFTYLPWLSYI